MLYRALSPGGDYQFGNGLSDFYTGADAVAQAIKTSLQLWQGEWWENTDVGVPYMQHILTVPATPTNVRAAEMLIQEAILGVQGVQSISTFSLSKTGRTYTMNATVQTVYGEVGLEEVPIG